MTINKTLLSKIKGITKAGIPIMDGREKGDTSDLLDEIILVNNYDFGKGEDGSEYVVFTITSNDTEFFFGSSVVSENFKELDNVLNDEEKTELFAAGIEMTIHQKKSNKNRMYTYNTFFPSVK